MNFKISKFQQKKFFFFKFPNIQITEKKHKEIKKAENFY